MSEWVDLELVSQDGTMYRGTVQMCTDPPELPTACLAALAQEGHQRRHEFRGLLDQRRALRNLARRNWQAGDPFPQPKPPPAIWPVCHCPVPCARPGERLHCVMLVEDTA